LAGDRIEGRVEFNGMAHGGPGWTERHAAAGRLGHARTAQAPI
jgi:hypothetical protein